VEQMEVISLDLLSLNYVVTSAITLITHCFTKFSEILRKRWNYAATGKFCSSAQNSVVGRKLWPYSLL